MSEKIKDKSVDDASERNLDEGLEESFPASDPPAATQPGADRPDRPDRGGKGEPTADT